MSADPWNRLSITVIEICLERERERFYCLLVVAGWFGSFALFCF